MTTPTFWQAVMTLAPEETFRVTDWLTETLPETISVSVLDEIGGRERVTVLFSERPDGAALDAVLAEALGEVPGYALEPLEDEDWVKKGLDGLKPVRAGRFYVHGSHDAPAPAGHSLLIEAGEAFGTGQHPTTKGCLLALDRVLKTGTPQNVLDLGCGTGVLAIGYARATGRRVLASDIDPIAVRWAKAAARGNGVGPLVQAVTATGFAHPAIRQAAPFDLILANILAGPLITLAPAMRRHTGAGSHLVLSGLLRHQSRAVEAAYRDQGFSLARRWPLDEWMTLELQR